MRDPECSAGGGLLELIPALTRDTAERIIAGRADAPPHVLAVAEHLFTVVVLTAGSAPTLFDWHRSCGGGGRWANPRFPPSVRESLKTNLRRA